MNDARKIESLRIYQITIAPCSNDTANSNRITVEFKQSLDAASYKFDALDHSSSSGKLTNTGSSLISLMNHRFCVDRLDDAMPEVIRRAEAYKAFAESDGKVYMQRGA